MRIFTLCYGLALLVSGLPIGAHVRLQTTEPVDGSVIAVSPASIELTFSELMHLTAVWIEQGNQPRRSLVTLPAKRAQHFSIALPQLRSGHYSVSWRGVGDDGHVAAGKIQFTLCTASASGRRMRNRSFQADPTLVLPHPIAALGDSRRDFHRARSCTQRVPISQSSTGNERVGNSSDTVLPPRRTISFQSTTKLHLDAFTVQA